MNKSFSVEIDANTGGNGQIFVSSVRSCGFLGFVGFNVKSQLPPPKSVGVIPEIPEVKTASKLFRSIADSVMTSDDEEKNDSAQLFSANTTPGYEHREYENGDPLKRVNWKLSAKTGKLIYREPMIPEVGRLLVWFYHSGDPALVGRKLGQMIWVSGYLLRLGLQHDILAYTAGGQLLWHIGREHSPKDALDQLLSIPPMSQDPEILQPETADWQFYIGGDDYEKV